MFTKQINTGLIALAIGASTAFAFNAPAKNTAKTLGVQWFQYNGGDVTSPSSYSELPSMPACNGSGNLCAIQAPEDGNSGRPTQGGVDSPITVRKFL